jgi:phage-related protein
VATNPVKPLVWIASSKKDLGRMPGDVQDVFGFALYQAQIGKKAGMAKPLKGFGSAAVIEVVEDWMSDTFRAVYTVKFANAVYVLHCFQKKSSKGIETPKPDLDLIRERFKAAEVHSRGPKP